jgi:hypothetical protein
MGAAVRTVFVRELSDGEELVVEGVPGESRVEDPRDRAIEVRRLVVGDRPPLDQERRPESNQS